MTVYSIPVVQGIFKGLDRTGTGAQETIAHGLGAMPTLISITPRVIDASCNVSGLGKDETNIYVTVTSGKHYDCLAVVV
jgi:hypothetical protein